MSEERVFLCSAWGIRKLRHKKSGPDLSNSKKSETIERKNEMKELEKTYDPSQIEDRLYRKWEEKKYFHAEVDRSKKPFTIVMPPPNVTGQLHMGHALDNTMQDILIRFKRMQGYSALWQPGTDHAAIATEVKVTEKLKEQGIDKKDEAYQEAASHLDMDLIQYRLSPDDQTLTAIYTTPQYLSQEAREKIEPYLSEPKVYTWQKYHFQ